MEPQDIELQDLPTVATNDIPPDSLIPIAFRESNLTPFELYKITLEQLRIKLTTLNVEEIYNAFEKDPEFTNILFELQNNLIVINYDETTLNNLVNDVQTFVVPQINEIIFALTNQSTGSLYNLYQELTSIRNILDFLQQQALNALKTIILSVPEIRNPNAPYADDSNYETLNNNYSFYLDGFYNFVYLNVFIENENSLNQATSIDIFNIQSVFDTLILNLEKNIIEVKIQFRLKNPLKSDLNTLIANKQITFYKNNFVGVNEIVYKVENIISSNAKGDHFSFSVFFNKNGLISYDLNDSSELLATNDIPLINTFTFQRLKYILNNSTIFPNDGAMFSAKIVPVTNIINIEVQNPEGAILNRLFALDIDASNILDDTLIFNVEIGTAFTSITLNNPKKRALFLLSTELTELNFNGSGLIILDGVGSESVTELSLTNETQITINDAENIIIYQTVSDFQDERTIDLEIIANSLKTLKIILDVGAVENYYKAYSFTIGTITKTFPLVWVGDENKALNQIDKIEINFNLDQDFLSTTILNSHQLTNSITEFVVEQTKLIGNQLFSLNLYLPLGVLSNRSSLNDPFGSASYTASNISLDIPERENEYRFRGGLYAKTFDNTTSDRVVITQNVHLTDWNVQNGIKIEKTPDEKALYIFVDNVNKKYYCKFDLQLSRDFNSDLDIVFLLDPPTAIINDPNPNFTTTYGYQIAGHVEIFRKTIPFATPNNSILEFVLDVDTGVATEEPYAEPIVDRFDSAQYWTIPEIEAYVAQEIAIIISGGTIDLSGYATVQNLNDAIALMVPLNQYNIDQNIIDNRLDDLENRVDDIDLEIINIQNDITNVQTDINDIQTNIQNIDEEISIIQQQIAEIEGVSQEYVDNLNFENQVRIVNASNWYDIDPERIPIDAVTIEIDIPLSAVKDHYYGILDQALPTNTETYINLKINIVKDLPTWQKQYSFEYQNDTPIPTTVISRRSDPLPTDINGAYCVPVYSNFSAWAKRVDPNETSFFKTAFWNNSNIFQTLNRKNTALFDTFETIKSVTPSYTQKYRIHDANGIYICNGSQLNALQAELHLGMTNNITEDSISAFSMNHSKKIPINIVFSLLKRRIIYFEINNPFASTTNVLFTIYHEDEKTLSLIQSKNYAYQLFALFSNANAVPIRDVEETSTPFISSLNPFSGSYSLKNAISHIKNLNMTYYDNNINQFIGNFDNVEGSTFALGINKLQSYDNQFIFNGRSKIYYRSSLTLISMNNSARDVDVVNVIASSPTTDQRNFITTYCSNCIGDPILNIKTNQIVSTTPYQHIWQIIEYNWGCKYRVQDSNMLIATDNYDGNINDVEQTQLYFTAYKDTGNFGAISPYNALNENKVFVVWNIKNLGAGISVGAIPYISKNFYDNTIVSQNMLFGITMSDVPELYSVAHTFILEGTIDLVEFFTNRFRYESAGTFTQIITTVNTFIANNPNPPFINIQLENYYFGISVNFHKISPSDTSDGAISYNTVISTANVLNITSMNSLPSPTNINNTI